MASNGVRERHRLGSLWRSHAGLLLSLPLLAGLAAIDFNRFGLDGDEATSRWLSSMSLSALFAHLRYGDAVFALYYSLLHFWALGGQSTPYLRALSLIFAVGSLPVVYLAARDLFGRRVAAWSPAFLCTSFLFLTYASMVRMYSMEVFFAALAALYAVRSMDARDRRAPWLFAAASIAAIFAHPMAVAWVAALSAGIFMFSVPRTSVAARLKGPISAIALFGVLPLALATRLNAMGAQIDWIGPLTAGKLVDSLAYFSGGGSAIAGVALAAIVATAWVNVMPAQRRRLALVLFWLGCSLGIVVLISLRKDVIQPYYYLYGWIALSIAGGVALERISARRGAYAAAGTLCALALLNAYLLQNNAWRHEDWRAAAAFLDGRVARNDAIVVYTGRNVRPLYYAMQETGDASYLARVVYPRRGLDQSGNPPTAETVARIVRRYDVVWLVLSHDNLHPSAAVDALLHDYPQRAVRVFHLVRIARLSRPERTT